MPSNSLPRAGDATIEYNGVAVRVRDLPSKGLRAMFGYGHGYHRRSVVKGDFSYTPDTCEVADANDNTVWIDRLTLICRGCGLDVT